MTDRSTFFSQDLKSHMHTFPSFDWLLCPSEGASRGISTGRQNTDQTFKLCFFWSDVKQDCVTALHKIFSETLFSSLHWTEKLCFKLGRLQINFDWFRESHKFKLFTSRLITQRVFSNDSGSSQLGLDICKVLLTEHLWPTRQYYQRSDLWTSCDHC